MDKTRIIVVEDNIVYCEFVCNLLAREGFRTVQAYHLSTAKKLLQQASDGDIVVSDLRLPDGDGIDLLRWMRKEGMTQPLIIMTNYAEVHTAVESMKLGSLDYIPKQLVEDKLMPLLHTILKERSIGRNRMPVFARDSSAFQKIMQLSRPEKGLQKRVNLMQQTTNSDLSRHYLPRQLRHLILQEYLSGVKTARQLSEEHGIPMSTIHKMGQRWKAKNSCSFVSTPNPYPIMSRVTSEEASELLSENKALRRRLEEALLRLEGYEIMGDILQEEYGIDLLKKSAAGQSSVSKKDTQQ